MFHAHLFICHRRCTCIILATDGVLG